MLFDFQRFRTTCPMVADRSVDIDFLEDRSVRCGRTYVFCDGASKGWHGACLVVPGRVWTPQNRYREPCGSRNVGSELAGLHLALALVPYGCRVTIVFDMLGLGLWMCGHQRAQTPVTKAAIEACADLIEGSSLDVEWVHHRGHQKDPSHFTFFNTLVDGLCKEGVEPSLLGTQQWPPANLPAPAIPA